MWMYFSFSLTLPQALPDLPESLLVDCLVYFLAEDSQGLERREARLAYIGSLLARHCSEVLLEQELVRLSLAQVQKKLTSLFNSPKPRV